MLIHSGKLPLRTESDRWNLGLRTLKCSQGDLARLANTSQPQSPVEDKYSEDIGEQKIDACNKILYHVMQLQGYQDKKYTWRGFGCWG